jgi:RNA polymerase sigma-70 factor (ECF subfamily)
MATRSTRFQGEEALVQRFSEANDVEGNMLKRRHGEIFSHALSVALRELTTRDRLVLRMNVVDRISTTRIAAIYKVSQPTVSRWIQRSARTIFATVKDLVCDELEIDSRELDSLLVLVRSQIEITISQVNGDSMSPA